MSRVNTLKELDSWHGRNSFPWVLKANGTWGGGGVRIVQSEDQAEQSFIQLSRMFRFSRAAKRLIVNRDPFSLWSWWNPSKRGVIAQSYIHGHPANCSVVCWNGRVLAAIGVEVVCSDGLTGPASVVRVIDNAEMMFAADKIASRLGLSGFFGLDFMIEEGTDAAYLIEMNPRSTPPCHLRLSRGRDLAGALWAQLGGRPSPENPPMTQHEMIAYFPQAFKNNLDMPQDCFEDIPHGEPELVKELLHPFPDRTRLFRLVQYMTRKPTPVEGLEIPKNPSQQPKTSGISQI
jgi:hypothetical protein